MSAAIDTFEERYVLHSESGSASRTAAKHAKNLTQFEEWLESQGMDLHSEITVEDFLRFRQYAKEQWSESKVSNATAAISLFFQIERPDDMNPVEEWDPKGGKWAVTTEKEKETRQKVYYLDPEQVQALVDNVPSPTFRNELIVKMLYMTGLRRSELVSIRLRDVDIERREIRIHAEKTDEYRDIGFRESLARPLRLWIESERAGEYGAEESDYLLPPASGRGDCPHLSAETVKNVVITAADNAGIQEVYTTDSQGRERRLVTPHCLRASFAVSCAKNDVSAPFVQKALGHSKLDVTQIYLDVADTDASDVIRERGPSL